MLWQYQITVPISAEPLLTWAEALKMSKQNKDSLLKKENIVNISLLICIYLETLQKRLRTNQFNLWNAIS